MSSVFPYSSIPVLAASSTLNPSDPPKSPVQLKARQKWKLLSNTIKAISLLKTCETRVMYDVDDLIEEVKSSPVKIKLNRQPSLVAELIDEHKLRENLFHYIKTSTPEDIKKIKEIIENDPRKYIISSTSPESLINKPLNDYRPIYEACKLGYFETAALLLSLGADPHLKCGKGNKENSLDVASRWRHHAVVAVLLEEKEWSKQELKHAMKHTSEGICQMIRSKMGDEAVDRCKCVVV